MTPPRARSGRSRIQPCRRTAHGRSSASWVLLTTGILAGGCPPVGGTDAGPVTSIDANVGAPTDAGTDAPSVGSAPIDAALGGSVTSADGVLTIEIPPGALAADIGAVILDQSATKFGAVESMSDAQKCADLFKANAGKIDGILVTLPNFGDERGVANAIRWSELKVPVMFHAFNDDPKTMTIKDRRDSFCGKMSVCNNLRQYGFPTP